MTALPCPDSDRLRCLLEGTLPADEEADLVSHFDNCSCCRGVLERLAGGGGTYAEQARRLSRPESNASDLESIIARILEPASQEFAALFTPTPGSAGLGRLGHYVVLEMIGRGGMGVVFRAHDETLNRVVAVKLLSAAPANNAPARQRFLREARAAAAVRDEHVISVYAVDEVNGTPYLVMEYIRGQSLEEKLARTGALELHEVLRIGMQVARGLSAAHAQGLAHRDIKPANILLENGVERVKITDFGLARVADDASLTQSGTVAGTPEYMAPEQAQGGFVDHRADLFSLGSILYTMCAGHPPFRASNPLAVLKRVVEDTPRPLRQINPAVPDWLEHLIAKLHAKDPADRFQSAAEVAVLLERCLARLQRSSTGPSSPLSPSPDPGRGWRRRAWFVVAVLCLAALAGAAFFWRHLWPSDSTAPAPRYALRFNGVDSRVDMPTLTYDGSHPLTIELWATIRQRDQPIANLICNNAVAVGIDGEQRWNGWVRDLPGDGLESRRFLWSDAPYQVNQPTHLAVVLDDRVWRLFVNGRLQAVQPQLRGNHVPSTQGFFLGVHHTPEGKTHASYAGLLHELRISRAARYERDFSPLSRFEPDLDTMALYHFDEGKGNVLTDSSGHGHHGIITAAQWVRVDGK
jgi:serine/threonine-protein kinase